MGRFFIVEIRADVADVGIREADNLAGITGVGENFLIAGEAGIKNDFAAATGTSARRTPVKYAPVLEREKRGGSVEPQVGLRMSSLQFAAGDRQRAKPFHWPVHKYCFAVNHVSRDGAEHARIVGAVAVVAEHEK